MIDNGLRLERLFFGGLLDRFWSEIIVPYDVN